MECREEVVANFVDVVDKVVPFDNFNDLTSLKSTDWVTHPGVVISVWLRSSSSWGVVETGRLHFFTVLECISNGEDGERTEIAYLNVTKSGGVFKFHFSCAQNVPVAPEIEDGQK